MSGETTVDTPRWLRRPQWLFVGGSLAAAALALLAECCGSALENGLLALDVLIICAWITLGRPSLEMAVLSVAVVTVAFAWFGGTPEPALFQPTLLAAGVGWHMAGLGRSCAFAALLVAVPFVGDMGPGASWGWWNWSIGTLFAWSMGRVIRTLERTLVELGEARSSLVAAAAMEERRRIARDVHDLVGHSLTAMLLNVRAARQALDSDPAAAAGALDDAVRIGRSGLADVRASMPGLRDPAAKANPAPMSALPDGRAILELLGRQTGLQISVHGRVEELDGPLAVALSRILHECLTNIARHAEPGSATVSLAVDDERVVLRSGNTLARRVRVCAPDDTATRRAFGLVGMRERVASLGGRFKAYRDGDSWHLDCELPRR